MNGYQRISAALRGEQPDVVPVMLHNFMMAAREAGFTMHQYRTDPQVIAQSMIQAVEKYHYDGVLVDVDTATLAGAVGVPVELPDDEPAITARARLETLEAVDDLGPPDVGKDWRIQVWLEGTKLLKAHFGDEVYVRGNCDQAPFALACLVRSMQGWLTDVMDPDNHERVHKLLEFCLEACNQFIRLMAQTGAHMVSNGDSSAGPSLVAPRIYREFALPYERRVAEYSHQLGLPWTVHICGKTDAILADMVESGADALELDYKTNVEKTQAALKDKITFIGNIDPSAVLALGTPELIERKTRDLCEGFSGNPRFILNAGCAIPASTPPENLRAMIRVAHGA